MKRHDRPAQRMDLDRAEALRLLGTVSMGRIVFTRQALPTARPVNHVLDGGDIVIRTQEGAALTSQAQPADDNGVVVAYEADAIDHTVRIHPDLITGILLIARGEAPEDG
ncbi:pyridoxamine 5'-phosphate oxidase family protein [Streptomyces sp. NPDC001165]|uniref:pyridoxamine 5'-phosphate oxidase family protein n=1 Tax=Streptomyces sp. NPDC001165 TaxID=3364546 RepID=UPI0036C686B2